MFKVSLIVPTYNEAENLPPFVEEIFNIIDQEKIDLEFIIVDDNSPDGTGKIAEELSQKYPIRVMHRARKLGLGSAVTEGFKLSDRPYIGVMDADLSHDPSILNKLILSLEECDIAMGNRFAEGSTVENWAKWRRTLSNVGVWFTKKLTGVKDPLSGYFFMKKEVISGVNLTTKGYKILLEILVKGHFDKVKEFPYKFRMRKFSSSKLSFKEYFLFLGQILEYSWYSLKNKDRIFFWGIMALSAVLLFYRISKRAFWMDEGAVVEYLYRTPNPISFLINYFQVPDNHPPLYYLLVISLYKILPLREAGIRLVSVLSGLGIVATVYYFSLLLFKNKSMARLSMFLTTVSPYFILISQMARYHSLSALFALLSLYFFVKLVLEDYTKKAFVGCLVFGVLTAYSDLPHFVYLVGIMNIYYFYGLFRKKQFVKLATWIKGQAVLFVLFLPIVWLFYLRIFNQGDGGFEKNSLLGKSVLNWVMDFLMHFYAYFFGENILPWNIVPFILGCMVGALLIISSFKVIKHKNHNLLLLAYLFFCAVILNVFFMNYADPRYNFIVYPKFVFVAFPLFVILISYLFLSFKEVWVRYTVLAVFMVVQLFGLYNFYHAQNYINGSYFNDFKEYQFVKDNSRPGDIIIINGDLNIGVYNFYKDSYFDKMTPVSEFDLNSTAQKKGIRYWFFSTGSDGDTGASSLSGADKIPAGFSVVNKYETVPLDPILKKIKEKILHRESYLYKYGVYLLIHN